MVRPAGPGWQADLAALCGGLAWSWPGGVQALYGIFLVWSVRGTPGRDALRGLLFGVVWAGMASRWVIPALADYGVDDASRAWGALALAHGVLLVPVWALAGALQPRVGTFALPLAWTALAAPLAEIAPMPLWPSTMVAGSWTAWTRLGGEALGTGAVLMVGAALASSARGRPGSRWLVPLFLPALWRPPDAPTVAVGVVQPDTGAFDGRRESTAEARTARLMQHLHELDHRDAALVVTPESAWPATWRGVPSDLDSHAPLLLGVHDQDGHQAMVAVEGGVETGRTDKVLGTPLTERQVWGWGKAGLTPGDGPGYVDVAGLRVGVLLCFEDTSPAALRRVLASDPDLIVIAANDAWNPGEGAAWHLLQAQAVAAMSGRAVVRAAASGPSAVIGPDGALLWSAPGRDGDAAFLPGEHAVVFVPVLHPAWTGAGASPYVSAAALLVALGVLVCRPPSAGG